MATSPAIIAPCHQVEDLPATQNQIGGFIALRLGDPAFKLGTCLLLQSTVLTLFIAAAVSDSRPLSCLRYPGGASCPLRRRMA